MVSLGHVAVVSTRWDEAGETVYVFPRGAGAGVGEAGLTQALLAFSSTFTSRPLRRLLTKRCVRLFYRPEPHFWFVMCVHGGHRLHALHSVLLQCYESVRLFVGALERVADERSREGVAQLLEGVLTKYLLSTVVGRLESRPPCQAMDGLLYLPSTPGPFLRVVSALHSIEAAHPSIRFSLLLHHDSLVWSGLSGEDTRVVFRYLTASLLPAFLDREKHHKSPLDPEASTTSGRFVCGPQSQSDMENWRGLPRVYLEGEGGGCPQFYRMAVYRLPCTTVAWFLPDKAPAHMHLFHSLQQSCREEIGPLVEGLRDEGVEKGAGSHDIMYIYLNRINRAVKDRPRQGRVPYLVLSLHAQHDRLVEEGGWSGETIAKTSRERWVCGRSSNSRHIYLFSSEKHRPVSLDEFNSQVDSLCLHQLSNIFFHL